MKRSRLFPLLFAFALPLTSFGQDTIVLKNNLTVLAKVMEVEDLKIRYKKFDNLDGPLYSIDKNEILGIRYSNGTSDIFNAALSDKKATLTKEECIKLIKTPKVNVFVSGQDTASIIHATRALEYGTNWNLVKEKSSAQVVVRFAFVSIGLGDKKGKAQFLDPNTDELIFETGVVNTAMSWDINTKRGVIDKIVRKEIKPLLK
ncbi:hypothetical protein [Flavihumibacter petaseus]|uniref:DUF4412 domain-containing protein n=1 Tax=Flavihumibacter petaseus NBRC 106054 TaxID=1220578 RepID=A0A0E9MXG8_9BACT|nr:hypothetical protein [Flavihumibacter petaseus]GAO42309.1 hypothetical protein FPE01S_01_13220 [Flavihumibacter petaseus NBRC 106054]